MTIEYYNIEDLEKLMNKYVKSVRDILRVDVRVSVYEDMLLTELEGECESYPDEDYKMAEVLIGIPQFRPFDQTLLKKCLAVLAHELGHAEYTLIIWESDMLPYYFVEEEEPEAWARGQKYASRWKIPDTYKKIALGVAQQCREEGLVELARKIMRAVTLKKITEWSNSDLTIFKLEMRDKNRYDVATKTITLDREYADSTTLDHELGHAIMYELVFGSIFKTPKIPDYMIAVEYAWLTLLAPEGVERADEGWAQSFCDYFNRPEYLKKRASVLYYFWDETIDLNPKILNIRKALHAKLKIISEQKITEW